MSSVIVVGAGHIGIACAHYLNEEGHDVSVIDQEGIGQACSRANCGFIVPSHVLPLTTSDNLLKGMRSVFSSRAPFRFELQMRSGLYRWMYEFSRRCFGRHALETAEVLKIILDGSAEAYRTLLTEQNFSCEAHDDGLLFVFRSPKALEAFAEEDDLLAESFSLKARTLSGEELVELEPALSNDLAGAFLYEDDAYLRPDKLNSEWSKMLMERGVRFETPCKLTGVEKSGDKVTGLLTSKGKLTADRYVFATGAWSTQLAKEIGCNIPIEPGKGYSITIDAPARKPAYPMLFLEAHIGVTPFEDSLRVGSMMEFVGYNDSIPEFRMEQLLDSARQILEVPDEPVVRDTWYGWRPMTWDGLPIVGRVPGLSNALLAAGHNMLGLTLAPITGKAIADLVQERQSSLPLDALSPQRFA